MSSGLGECCPAPTGQLCAMSSLKRQLRAPSQTFYSTEVPLGHGYSGLADEDGHKDGCISSLISAAEYVHCAVLHSQLSVWLLQWYCTPQPQGKGSAYLKQRDGQRRQITSNEGCIVKNFIELSIFISLK